MNEEEKKYYVFETAIANGKQATATTIKNNWEEALMLFHQIRASCLANKAVTYSLTILMDEWGNISQKESYVRQEEENNGND